MSIPREVYLESIARIENSARELKENAIEYRCELFRDMAYEQFSLAGELRRIMEERHED